MEAQTRHDKKRGLIIVYVNNNQIECFDVLKNETFVPEKGYFSKYTKPLSYDLFKHEIRDLKNGCYINKDLIFVNRFPKI